MDQQAAKRRDKKNGSSNSMEDRLSELPQPILHHILSLLSQKEAVQTCVLSKTWRYLGPTRPKIDLCGICDKCVTLQPGLRKNKFCENCFGGNEKAFLSVLEKTLQRYHDQKLFTHELRLKMLEVGPDSFSLLEKWVPKLITPYLAVKTFDIRFDDTFGHVKYFDLPSSEVFSIKTLEKLHLQRCRLNKTDFVDRVLQCNRLQTISLFRVLVADETLEKIISSCPLIENLAVEWCEVLQTVKLINKHLKHLRITLSHALDFEDCQSVEIIDAPALETINIDNCRNLYIHNKHLRNLKSLHLSGVHLSSEFFENLSSKFPCLEELYICGGIHFDEFHLSSRSIKRLTIVFLDKMTKVTIDAPSLLFFEINDDFPRISKLSFTKIPNESLVDIWFTDEYDNDVIPWFVNLHELLRALGQSQKITLKTYFCRLPDHETAGGFNEPVVVENLCMGLSAGYDYASPSLPDFLNGLFRICRPRYADAHYWNNSVDIRFIGFLCKVLVQEREQRTYHWQRDLEDAEMEFWDTNAKEWNPTTLEEFRLLNKEKIRFRLKWRD